MADEFDGGGLDVGAVSVMKEEEPLRPPESWPGAAGLRSVAPEVPSWPTGPITGLSAPAAAVPTAPRKNGTGEGWPGVGGPVAPASPSPASSTEPKPGRRSARAGRSGSRGGGHPAMGPSIMLLLACVAIAAWVLLDSGSRAAQASVLAVVLIAGGVFVARTLRRPRGGRTKQ